MTEFIPEIEELIEELSKLPSIGRKTAQKLAFHILSQENHSALKLAETIKKAKTNVKFCEICGNYSNTDLCEYCSSMTRTRNVICVVEEARDIYFVESTNEFKGLYHVLGGAISPLDGIYPEDIRIKELLKRLVDVDEIILATNSTVQGEATAMYISRLLKPMGIKVTKLATGMPMGGDLEYADELTLTKALERRYEL